MSRYPDLLITNGWVVTVDAERRQFRPGFVAVTDDCISAVGPMADCPERAGETIDASGRAVLPGLVNAHTHGVYNLLRGGVSDDRALYDWLLNVVHPGLAAMGPDDAHVAASLFSIEALRSGITMVVDNADSGRFPAVADATLSAYERFGLRVAYARMFNDVVPQEMSAYSDAVVAREPGVHHFDTTEPTGVALASIEELMRRHNGAADGRISVWPAPGVAGFTTREGLLGAKELAHKWNTMLTIHVAESAFDRLLAGVSSIDYLAMIGFLGPDVLAAHCVQVDTNDIRTLSSHDVKVAYNPVSNMFLAAGIAPAAEMQMANITVALGTDDPNCNSSVNMVSDLKFAVLAQKGRYQHPSAMTAEKALDMATIDGARAVGKDDEIGSLEVGKKADLIVLDLTRPQMAPVYSVPSVLVYQASGSEIETVVVDGRVRLRDGTLTMLEAGEELYLTEQAQVASAGVLERAGINAMRAPSMKSGLR